MVKGNSKIIKHFILVIILILVSLDSIQTRSHTMKIGVITLDISSDTGESDFFNSITAINGSDYLITGETGEVNDPTTVCTSENQIVILWREILWQESIYHLCISKFTSNLSIIVNRKLVVNSSLLTSVTHELSQPKLLIDSLDNLHLFWYIFRLDTSPQLGDIYYQKLNSNLESIISPRKIHTYTHGGISNSADNTIRTILMDDSDSIHMTVRDGTYYILNNIGEVKASTIIPEELGAIEDLSLDTEGNALILCEDLHGDHKIYTIKYIIGATTITEHCRSTVFDSTDRHVSYSRLQLINNVSYFYLYWKSWDAFTDHYESFTLNSNGSVVQSGFLNKNFYEYRTTYLNSTHAVSLNDDMRNWDEPPKIYFSSYHPSQNLNYTVRKLLLSYLANEDYMYPPSIFDQRIIPDMSSQLIISWLVNDGQNGFQIFLLKCNLEGTITAPLVVVVPELQYTSINNSEVISLPRLPLLILSFTISIVIPILLNRKRKKISEKRRNE